MKFGKETEQAKYLSTPLSHIHHKVKERSNEVTDSMIWKNIAASRTQVTSTSLYIENRNNGIDREERNKYAISTYCDKRSKSYFWKNKIKQI